MCTVYYIAVVLCITIFLLSVQGDLAKKKIYPTLWYEGLYFVEGRH